MFNFFKKPKKQNKIIKSIDQTNKRGADWWDNWFIGLAKYVATASKDPSTKVGAIIVDSNRRVVSMGYNGFPCGINDDTLRLNNREKKYKIVVHAERNALLFSNQDLSGCSIYTYPFMPCSSCASMIIQSGIKRVVSCKSNNPRWKTEFDLSKELLLEAGVTLFLLD